MAKLIDRLEWIGLMIAAFFVCAIMFIVSFDAFSRYALHAPLPWAYEVISYYLLASAAYFGVSATFKGGDHIAVDLFRDNIRPWLRARTDAVWSLAAAGAFAIVAYGTWREMAHSFARNEFLPGYITWPAWVSYLPVILGFGLLVLRLLVHAAVLLTKGEGHHIVTLGEHHK